MCEVPGLVAARKAARLSQAALAERLGVRKMTVFRWENGQTEPSLAVLRRLAELLGCSTQDLLTPPTAQAS